MPATSNTVSPEALTVRLSDWLLRVVDVGMGGVIFLAPLFMGGRGPVGKLVFLALVAVAAVAWSVRQCLLSRARWRWSGVEWLLLAGVLLIVLQLLPLSPSLHARLSPATADVLPLWSQAEAAGSFARWSTVSLTPAATRGGLAVFVGYALLFLLLVQRLHEVGDVERLLRWLALGVVVMAAVGLAQLLLGNGKFLWVFEHPSRDTFRAVKGSFQNQNHFVHFLALGVGPLIWWLGAGRLPTAARHALAVGLGLVAIAALLTFSRGGVIVIALAAVVGTGVLVWKSVLDRRALWAAAAMGVLVAVALCIYGYQPLAGRLTALGNSRSLEEVSRGRSELWKALLDAAPDFALLGAGIGSHRDVYPMYLQTYFNVEFTHGENGYLPLLLEAGAGGLVLLIVGMGICFFWCGAALRRGPQPREGAPHRGPPGGRRRKSQPSTKWRLAACAGAILPGLVASAFHALGDFVWYLSACMALTVMLAACACRVYQLSVAEAGANDGTAASWWRRMFAGASPAAGRTAWIAVTVIVALTSLAIVADRLRPALAAPQYYAFLKLSLDAYADGPPAEEKERELLFAMQRHLEQALRWHPGDPRANMRLAGVCLRRFELEQRHAINPMALSQIREAALASQFPSKAAQDAWLDVAIGEHRQLLDLALQHCRRGLRGCPLLGEGYVYLADLSFLEGPRQEAKHAYISQAQQVRPHSGMVLFATGQEAALEGDLERAIEFWKRAFHQDPEIRALIIDSFAAGVPASFFLDNFELDMVGLRALYGHYHRLQRREAIHEVGVRLLAALADEAATAAPARASDLWHESRAVYFHLGAREPALACGRRAVELDPGHFEKRRQLAALLVLNQQFAEAVEHLQWCVRRRPDNADLARQLADAKRRSRRPATGGGPRAAARPGGFQEESALSPAPRFR